MKVLKKIVMLLALSCLSRDLPAQTETFDSATCMTSKGWKKESKAGSVSYTFVDAGIVLPRYLAHRAERVGPDALYRRSEY